MGALFCCALLMRVIFLRGRGRGAVRRFEGKGAVSVELGTFVAHLMTNPLMVAVTLLNVGVIIVNGATDAPNAIATVVSTRSMKPRPAIILAAVCNFLGLLVVSMFTSAVASTIFNMVNFGGDNTVAIAALAAAMVAIIVWGGAAWYFGIPTSQSHSLIAGLTGAAIAAMGSLDAINWNEWIKVIYGILLSTFLGFGLGWFTAKVVAFLCRGVNRHKANEVFHWCQIAAGAGVAFMHGAQDGQKFMSVFLLGIALSAGLGQSAELALPIWLMVLCAINMGLGTAIGGERIIKNVAMNMTHLEVYQGFSASFSATLCLILATFTGMPVSTTHVKTTAIMGVGAAKRKTAVKWQVAIDMVKTWVLTFPGCGLIGFLMAELFLMFI